MRVISSIYYNVKLQYRHGFYAAYLVVCAVYIGIMLLFSPSIRLFLAPLLVFSDPAMLGLFFVGGIILMEREEQSLDALMVTPLRPTEYFLAKIVSLTLLAVLSSLALAVAGSGGFGFSMYLFLPAVLLTSSACIMTGVAVASRSDSVVSYIMSVVPITIVMVLPFVDYFGLWTSPWFYLIPTHASLTLIGGSFAAGGVAPWEIGASVAVLAAWNVGAWFWGDRRFRRHVIEGKE